MQDDIIQQWTDDDLAFAEKYPDGVPLVEMIPFYEMVARDEPLQLEWVCFGKQDPRSEQKSTPIPHSLPSAAPKVSESQPDASKLAEFDFDETTNPSPFHSGIVDANQPLRRVVAPGRHPVRQPRVANMDKILNDLFRARKEASQQPHNPTETTHNLTSNGTSEADRGGHEQPNVSACDDTHGEPEINLSSLASERVLDADAPLIMNMNDIALDDSVVKSAFQALSDCDEVSAMSDQSLVSNIDFPVRDAIFQDHPVCDDSAADVWSTASMLDRIDPPASIDSGQTH